MKCTSLSQSFISEEIDLPVHWSPEENITWRLKLPSWSGATPIVWEDYVFLNVAEEDGEMLSLWCVDRVEGEVLWKKSLGGGNPKMRKQIAKKRNDIFHTKLCEASWQGVNYVNRLNDSTIVKYYFTWLNMWATCPSSTISEFFFQCLMLPTY